MLYMNDSCVDKESTNCHYYITIINDSDFDIYFNMPIDTTGFYYAASAMIANAFRYKVNAHNNKKYKDRECIEYKFTKGVTFPNGKYAPLDSLRVYILDATVLEQDLKYKTLIRYDLSLDNLRYLNWTVTYPPGEEMKNIVMYPPYGK